MIWYCRYGPKARVPGTRKGPGATTWGKASHCVGYSGPNRNPSGRIHTRRQKPLLLVPQSCKDWATSQGGTCEHEYEDSHGVAGLTDGQPKRKRRGYQRMPFCLFFFLKIVASWIVAGQGKGASQTFAYIDCGLSLL